MSSADNPESDGRSERSNRILEDILRTFAQSRPRTWSSMLPHVSFAYNTSAHASTGVSPYYANHLRHPRTPTSLGMPRLRGGAWEPPKIYPCAQRHQFAAFSRRETLLCNKYETSLDRSFSYQSKDQRHSLSFRLTIRLASPPNILCWQTETTCSPFQRRRSIASKRHLDTLVHHL
jgi:hypothetical protein